MSRRPRHLFTLVWVPLLALVWIFWASPGLALYLFLDSNGDGVRTPADVLSPQDTTRVTVWLIPDQNKEGTTDDCSHGRRAESHRYAIVFQAVGGTVAWGPFIPDQSTTGGSLSYDSDDSTYFKVSRSILDWGASRSVRLGAFTVVVKRGRPSIAIVSRRPGQPFDETRISTGTWDGPFDRCADGLPYGGQANRPPELVRLGDDIIRPGLTERLIIEATDRDGDPLSFRLVHGPSFASVRTLDPGHGVAYGEISLEPDSCAQGPSDCIIEVSDGFASDVDTMGIAVKPQVRPVPTSPMQSPVVQEPAPIPTDSTPLDVTWLTGEWEWHETSLRVALGGIVDGPARRGYRRRLIFHRNGSLELFEIGRDRVVRAQNGTYTVARIPGGAQIAFSRWFDSFWMREGSASFFAAKEGPSTLSLYPWGVTDASSESFVRVPTLRSEGPPADTLRVLAPIDTPTVWSDHDGVHVRLPEAMKAALRRYDPAFRLWSEADSRSVHGGRKERRRQGASAIAGDFDGDLLPDVALLGRSGADQVVVAILSHHGNITAMEVAWRRVRAPQGENKSRGDPREVPIVDLERVPAGSRNPFCWIHRWDAAPVDGIGIVEPGVARFDYILDKDRFTLFAPVP